MIWDTVLEFLATNLYERAEKPFSRPKKVLGAKKGQESKARTDLKTEYLLTYLTFNKMFSSKSSKAKSY